MVAIDVGYGLVKAISAAGRAIFPAAVAPRRAAGELAGALGAAAPRYAVDVHHASADAPERYWVGHAALDAGAGRTWTEASARTGYDILILTGAALVGAQGQTDLALGLPLGVWVRGREERQALREQLEGAGAWVAVDGEPARRIEIGRVRVYPQALGAYLAAVQGPDGWRLAGRPVGVVDIGYRTTDYLLLTVRDGTPAPDEERSGSADLGIGRAYDAVRGAVAAQTGGLPPPEAVIEAALTGAGAIAFRGREIDLRPSWEAACRELAAEIVAYIRRAWADRIDYLGAVVIAGGGGAALARYLDLPMAVLPSEPVWANAVGFLALAERQGARV